MRLTNNKRFPSEAETYTFDIDTDVSNYIKNIRINDEMIQFPSSNACPILIDIYKRFIEPPRPHNAGHIVPKIDTEQQNSLREMFENIWIPKDIKIFSNGTNPYVGYSPHPSGDKLLLSKKINLLKLCEAFMKIQDTEDRFGIFTDPEKRTIRFWYNWKD